MSNDLRPEDDLGLAGRVAIVTGGGAPDDGIGNGRAAALLLARSGAKVMVVDIVREAAEQTVSMIAAEGGIAAPFVADVADEIQCKGLIDATIKMFGRLDLLDNNVGIGGRGSVIDTPVDQWRRIMQVNVDSMFFVSRYAIPAMVETANGGAIVNVSSISALRPPDRVFDIKRSGDCADAGDGGRSRTPEHSRELRRPGADLYAPHVYGADDTGRARGAP